MLRDIHLLIIQVLLLKLKVIVKVDQTLAMVNVKMELTSLDLTQMMAVETLRMLNTEVVTTREGSKKDVLNLTERDSPKQLEMVKNFILLLKVPMEVLTLTISITLTTETLLLITIAEMDTESTEDIMILVPTRTKKDTQVDLIKMMVILMVLLMKIRVPSKNLLEKTLKVSQDGKVTTMLTRTNNSSVNISEYSKFDITLF